MNDDKTEGGFMLEITALKERIDDHQASIDRILTQIETILYLIKKMVVKR